MFGQPVSFSTVRLFRMTEIEILIAVVVVLLGGMALPLSSGARWTLFLLLIGVLVLAGLGGGMQYFLGMFD